MMRYALILCVWFITAQASEYHDPWCAVADSQPCLALSPEALYCTNPLQPSNYPNMIRVGMLYSAIALASAALAAPSSLHDRGGQPGHLAARSNSSTAGTKIILDNDWSTAGFLTYLMALNEGWDVLGIVGDTGDSWALQTSLHGLATLEVGGLSSCIPVYKGADYPLVNTPELFQTWEDLHGDLAWVRTTTACFPCTAGGLFI